MNERRPRPGGQTLRILLLGVVLFAFSLLAAGAPAVGEAGPARATAPLDVPRDKLLGFSGIRPRDDLAPLKTARLIAAVGGSATRTAIHWQALEPQRDRYDEPAFAVVEELYDGLRSRKIMPVLVLQYAPAWARDAGLPRLCGSSDSCHYPPAAAMLGEWREFVRSIAQRFPDAAIEVWNEPNYRGQWRSGVDPARYARLLAAADAAAASVDPDMPVYMGGLGTAVKENSQSPEEFLRGAYDATPSLRGHTDALNLHLFPERFLGPGSAFGRAFAGVRAARADGRDRGTPILVSELGRTTTGPFRISQSAQAGILLRATRKIIAMRDTLGVLLYTLADRDELPQDGHERGFGVGDAGPGLLSRSFDPKAAYCRLREAAGRPFAGCPGSQTAAGRRLRARVRPRHASVAAGRGTQRFTVRVDAPTAKSTIKRVRICVGDRVKALRLASRECRFAGTLRPGRTARASFKFGLRRDAGGAPKLLRFRASGLRAKPDRARATLRPG